MSIAASYRAELLKTKRTASFWLSLAGAAFIPVIFLAAYLLKPENFTKDNAGDPWPVHFFVAWQVLGSFLLPMYVILLCALVPQIEFKNNTWKQVYASPQSYGDIYFSKLLGIHTMLLFFYVSFNLLLIGTGVIAALVHPQIAFLKYGIDWKDLLSLNAKMYISTLGISALQYWLSLRFKNFIAPVGIGLALLIASIVASAFHWEHVYKLPFAHPNLSLDGWRHKATYWLHNHEWNAIVCFGLFTAAGFMDVRWRKEKG